MEDASFSSTDFHTICDKLADLDADLGKIILQHGYPPLWSRQPGFATLVHIILEQQVSLASARAALDKLVKQIGTVTPSKLLALTDEELKDCYFSRQKIVYTRDLAAHVLEGRLRPDAFDRLSNEEIRRELTAVKGIGQWTVDVYLMIVLHRCDLFPLGDIALINSTKAVKNLPVTASREEIALMANNWQPYRTVAAFLLWHAYIIRRGMKVAPYP